jgi:hypothetical protein
VMMSALLVRRPSPQPLSHAPTVARGRRSHLDMAAGRHRIVSRGACKPVNRQPAAPSTKPVENGQRNPPTLAACGIESMRTGISRLIAEANTSPP